MAMNINRDTTSVMAASNGGTYEKAQAFLNLSLPNEEGGLTKIGAIPLKASNPDHVILMEMMNKGSEDEKRELLEVILENFSMTYNSAEKKARGIKLKSA